MKKLFSKMLMLTMMLGLAMGFTACSDDDDNNGGSSNVPADLIGTWIPVSGVEYSADGTAGETNTSFDAGDWWVFTQDKVWESGIIDVIEVDPSPYTYNNGEIRWTGEFSARATVEELTADKLVVKVYNDEGGYLYITFKKWTEAEKVATFKGTWVLGALDEYDTNGEFVSRTDGFEGHNYWLVDQYQLKQIDMPVMVGNSGTASYTYSNGKLTVDGKTYDVLVQTPTYLQVKVPYTNGYKVLEFSRIVRK